jgi:hypothetical protein
MTVGSEMTGSCVPLGLKARQPFITRRVVVFLVGEQHDAQRLMRLFLWLLEKGLCLALRQRAIAIHSGARIVPKGIAKSVIVL